MDKKTKSITITQYDYFIKNVNDEEVDIHGHPNHYSEYDQAGNPLKEIKYNRLGEFEEMVEYGYDEQGNLLRESYYQMEDEIAEEKSFVRDENGIIIRALKQYKDGSLDTISYQYNDSGQLIKRITTTDEGIVEQVESFVWENGVIVDHQIVDEDGELQAEAENVGIRQGETRITKNDNDQVITEEELDDDGEVYMTVNRSYDEDGRAAEVEVFIDGQGRAISRHYYLKYEYTYYD